MIDLAVSLFLVAGALFTLIGSIGLARLPDVFMRLHGPTKASTLGVGCVLAGSMLHFTAASGTPAVETLLIAVFLFMTAPVSAHLLARAALHRRCESRCPLPDDPGRPAPDAG